jgi:superfamily II DNA or RNA helicase
MKLRPYQRRAKDLTFASWAEGNRSVLDVMPTGGGKTVLFAAIAKELLPRRTMVLAHRQELVWQAKSKMETIAQVPVEVEMGDLRASVDRGLFHPRSDIIVSTIQTHTSGGDGGGRLSKFNPEDFGLLIIDEAHHATSPSYRRVIDYYMQNPDLVVLGVTATPDRADEEALGQIFSAVGFDYEIIDAIRDGWLVPVEQQMVEVDVDFTSVRTTAGDLNGADLAALMESEKPLQGIAGATIDIAGNRRGIGFAASVAHAHSLAEIFNRHRSGMAAVVHGKTDPDERKRIVQQFSDGYIQWLWNCGVFTEGFDDDGVEVIAMGRPTKSRALYAQMGGRAMRPHRDVAHKLGTAPDSAAAVRRAMIARSLKPSCLIVDFVGNAGRHKLMSTADILGGNVSDPVIAAVAEMARKSGKPVRMAEAIMDEEERQREIEAKRLEQEARRAGLLAKVNHTKKSIDPFDILALEQVKSRGWDRGKPISEGMAKTIRKAGLDPTKMTYAQAKQLCGVLIERWNTDKCTIKQAATLERFGFPKSEAAAMSFDNARRTLDAIAANGWRRPAKLPKILKKAPARSAAPRADNDGGEIAERRPARVFVSAPVEDDVPF